MTDNKPKLLLVDDGDRYAELAHALLRDYNYATLCELDGPCWECPFRDGCALTHAHDWSETASVLSRHTDIDVVLLDVDFSKLSEQRLLKGPKGDLQRTKRLQGLEILRALRKKHPTLPVILMTSVGELEFERGAAELEVDEYVTLAGADVFDARALGLLIERILSRAVVGDTVGEYVWGTSKAMARIHADLSSLAQSSLPMLIQGAPGTGKSALAERVIHPATRRKGPFVVVDLAAIPQNLVASELFGSCKGAFSGAVDRPGCFERADGGTVFLDEIGNLLPEVQRMLLVTLQSGRITRLGGGQPQAVDVKLVAATNADLRAQLNSGAFRGDLYARLNPAARIELPRLYDRSGEIESLAAHIVESVFTQGPDRELIDSYMRATGLQGPVGAQLLGIDQDSGTARSVAFTMGAKSWAALKRHHWPGNIRELELLIKNATVMALFDALRAARAGRDAPSLRLIPIPAKLIADLLAGFAVDSKRPLAVDPSDGFFASIKPSPAIRDVMRQIERDIFARLYKETKGDFARMASKLLTGDPEVNARKVRLRFNQLGLRVEQFR